MWYHTQRFREQHSIILLQNGPKITVGLLDLLICLDTIRLLRFYSNIKKLRPLNLGGCKKYEKLCRRPCFKMFGLPCFRLRACAMVQPMGVISTVMDIYIKAYDGRCQWWEVKRTLREPSRPRTAIGSHNGTSLTSASPHSPLNDASSLVRRQWSDTWSHCHTFKHGSVNCKSWPLENSHGAHKGRVVYGVVRAVARAGAEPPGGGGSLPEEIRFSRHHGLQEVGTLSY